MLTMFIRRQRISYLFNFVFPRVINGKRFWIPVFLKTGMGNYFMTELWLVDVLKRLPLDEHGVFVDLGANIGQTLLKLRSVHPMMPYVGIEPNPC